MRSAAECSRTAEAARKSLTVVYAMNRIEDQKTVAPRHVIIEQNSETANGVNSFANEGLSKTGDEPKALRLQPIEEQSWRGFREYDSPLAG